MSQLAGVPGGGQVWKIGNVHYIVYTTPRRGVPIAYRLRDDAQLRDLFPGSSPNIARSFSNMADARRATGVLNVGHREELTGTAEHPFTSLVSKYERMVVTNPWLADPEVMALYASAILEGRTITASELASTSWFQSRTQGEREWAVLSLSDPSTANQLRTDNRNAVINTMTQAGIGFFSGFDRLADFITERWTQGSWTQGYTTEQIRRLADPWRGPLDDSLARAASSMDRSGRGPTPLITREHTDTVRELVSRWLGPHVAANWSPERVREWAGRLRNDPDAEKALTDHLRTQRMAKYSAYTDQNLTYEDIDSLWRPMVRAIWGEDPTPGDATYEHILQINDSARAEQVLRREGLRRNNRQVGQTLLRDLHGALGGSVREMR
jgi:hypothetical protein